MSSVRQTIMLDVGSVHCLSVCERSRCTCFQEIVHKPQLSTNKCFVSTDITILHCVLFLDEDFNSSFQSFYKLLRVVIIDTFDPISDFKTIKNVSMPEAAQQSQGKIVLTLFFAYIQLHKTWSQHMVFALMFHRVLKNYQQCSVLKRSAYLTNVGYIYLVHLFLSDGLCLSRKEVCFAESSQIALKWGSSCLREKISYRLLQIMQDFIHCHIMTVIGDITSH